MTTFWADKSGWHFEAAQSTYERLGRLVTANGRFVSRIQATPAIVDKAIKTLESLFTFLNEHDVTLVEDSEQGDVLIDLGNGFEVAYQNSEHNKATLFHNGYLVGYLSRDHLLD